MGRPTGKLHFNTGRRIVKWGAVYSDRWLGAWLYHIAAAPNDYWWWRYRNRWLWHIPYGRVVNNPTGTALARHIVGMARNAFTALDGYDDATQESWFWGYVDKYDPNNGNAMIAGTNHWTVAYIPPNTSPTSGVFDEYLTISAGGTVQVSADPTTSLGVATKNYVDTRMKGGEAFFTGDGSTTTFFVAHGIGATPSRATLTPMNQASVGCWYTKRCH